MPNKNTVLVALVRTKKDWMQVKEQGVYRIPERKAPPLVRDYTIEYIAFYLPSIFEEEAFKVSYYGKVHTIKSRKRLDIVPDEPDHPKAQASYLQIEIEELISLQEPFVSLRPRRLLFIPTTKQKFFQPLANEINHLFNESPLENLLWDSFVNKDIPAERQYAVEAKDRTFVLDFAIFCQKKNIDIECDGDTYHNSKKAIEYDKKRNNLLTSNGWAVLRYTTDELTKNLNGVTEEVTDTINLYGGVTEPSSDYVRYIRKDGDSQQRLFD